VAKPSVCPKCGQEHPAGACRAAKLAKDVELQEVYSGRRSAVELMNELEELDLTGQPKAAPQSVSSHVIPAPKIAGTAPAGTALKVSEVRPEEFLSHSDPYVVALAKQLISRDKLVESMRSAAKTALDYTKEREAHLATRENRIREAAEALRRQRESIERREAILEQKLAELEQGRRELTKARVDFESEQRLARETMASKLQEVEARDREVARREEQLRQATDKLAASRIEVERMKADAESGIRLREERLASLEQEAKVRRLDLEAKLNKRLLAMSGVQRPHERVPVAGDASTEGGSSVGLVGATVTAPAAPHPVGAGPPGDALEEVERMRAKVAAENERLSAWGKEVRRKEEKLAAAAAALAEREARLAEMEKRAGRVELERQSTER
jgi:DNA repair exonuclease SbcCD ATPase subunit